MQIDDILCSIDRPQINTLLEKRSKTYSLGIKQNMALGQRINELIFCNGNKKTVIATGNNTAWDDMWGYEHKFIVITGEITMPLSSYNYDLS